MPKISGTLIFDCRERSYFLFPVAPAKRVPLRSNVYIELLNWPRLPDYFQNLGQFSFIFYYSKDSWVNDFPHSQCFKIRANSVNL